MKDRLERRLRELKAEYESGKNMLADLEAQQANLRETLLRISGAIQVLEEELTRASQPAEDPLGPPEDVQAIPAAEELATAAA